MDAPYVCMYVCMYVRMHVSKNVCMYCTVIVIVNVNVNVDVNVCTQVRKEAANTDELMNGIGVVCVDVCTSEAMVIVLYI